MTKPELEAMVARHEMQRLEFKESCDAEAIESACAFANANGGFILIGVTDAGQISKKLLRFEALRDYENRISTATEPRVSVDAEKVSFLDGEIVLLKVAENPLKPVAVKGRSFVRKGSVNHQMTPSEIAECHLKSTGSSMDAVTVPGVTKDDLDMEVVRRYMQKAVEEGRRDYKADDDPWVILNKLKWVKSETEITRAAYLLFAKEPQLEFPQAIVHIGVFRLNGAVILDTLDIKGNVQYQIDESLAFIKRNIRCAIEFTGKAEHERYWEYPADALRETIANAICHRDYGSSYATQIKIFEDRLVVISPGQLPFDMPFEQLFNPNHASHPRNKMLAQAFYDMHIIEQYGSGIERIKVECDKNGNTYPEWHDKNGEFTTIYVPRTAKTSENEFIVPSTGTINGTIKSESGTINPVDDTISDTIKLVGDTITSNPGIKREMISEKTKVPLRTLARALVVLEHQGKIIYRGSKKTGGYFPYDATIDGKEPAQ